MELIKRLSATPSNQQAEMSLNCLKPDCVGMRVSMTGLYETAEERRGKKSEVGKDEEEEEEQEGQNMKELTDYELRRTTLGKLMMVVYHVSCPM